jgi:hypothetical protein
MNNLFTPFSENANKYIDKIFINNGMFVLYRKSRDNHILEYFEKGYINNFLDGENMANLTFDITFANDNTGQMIFFENYGNIPNDTIQKILSDCSQIPKNKQLYVPKYCINNHDKSNYCEKLFSEGKAHKIIYMNKGKEEVSYMITNNSHIMFA